MVVEAGRYIRLVCSARVPRCTRQSSCPFYFVHDVYKIPVSQTEPSGKKGEAKKPASLVRRLVSSLALLRTVCVAFGSMSLRPLSN